MTFRDEHYPPPRGREERKRDGEPTPLWAARTLNRWEADGCPDLMGGPAEQVHLAKSLLGMTGGE